MDYFLVVPDEDGIPLGTQSFGFFYEDWGFDYLVSMAEKKPNLIKFVKIITDSGEQYTVEQFLSKFEGSGGLKMRRRS